jgi:type II secretory pathway component GspD/PulD (secretin)
MSLTAKQISRQLRQPLRLFLILLLVLPTPGISLAQRQKPTGARIAVCMIQLEHADAEELAAVLEPFLSAAGSIVPYRPTNTLIIRDRASVVDKLSIAIKGRPGTSVSERPEVETGVEREESHLDQ